MDKFRQLLDPQGGRGDGYGPAGVHLAIYALGLLTSLSLIVRTLNFLYPFLRPSALPRYLHTADGQPAWALVTGASDGIGKQLARELARRGFNVVLHGRNPAKLSGVRGELAAEFGPGREFRTLVADASALPCSNCSPLAAASPAKSTRSSTKESNGPALVDFDAIMEQLSDINLTVLINNAGGNPYAPVYANLQEHSPSKLSRLVNLNAVFPLILQARLLPRLLSNSPSLIINIGSMSDLGLPMLSAYSPNKAHMNKTTEIVARELAMQGRAGDVEIMAMRVGEVCGTAYNKSTPSLFEPDSETMARAILARVGCGKIVFEPYLPHALQSASLALIPGFILERVMRSLIVVRWKADQEMLKRAL